MGERKNKYAKTNKAFRPSHYPFGIGIVSLACIIFILGQSNFTVIDYTHLLGFFLLTGLAGSLLTYKWRTLQPFDWAIFGYRIVAFGLTTSALFFITNKFLTNEKSYARKLPIQNMYGTSYRNTVPSVIVEIDGLEKRVYIHGFTEQEIMQSQYITLQLRNGFWGFIIIDDARIEIKK